MMKKKTARRFLSRNRWKIAKEKIDEWPSKAFKKHVELCQKILKTNTVNENPVA